MGSELSNPVCPTYYSPGGPLLESEPSLVVSEADVAQIVEVVAKKAKQGSPVR